MRCVPFLLMLTLCGCQPSGGGGGGSDTPDDGLVDMRSPAGDGGLADLGPASDGGAPDGGPPDGGPPDGPPGIDPDVCGWQSVNMGSPLGSHALLGSSAPDPAGGLAVAWRDATQDLLWVRRSGGLAERVPVLLRGASPELLFDDAGGMHVFAMADRRLVHAFATADGWRIKDVVYQPDARISHLHIAAGGGQVYVAYQQDDTLRAARLVDGEWQHEVARENINFNALTLHVDARGTPYVSTWNGGFRATYGRRTDEGWQFQNMDRASRPISVVVDDQGWPHLLSADFDTLLSWSWNGREFAFDRIEEFELWDQLRSYHHVLHPSGARYAVLRFEDRISLVDLESGARFATLSGQFTDVSRPVWRDGMLWFMAADSTFGTMSTVAFKLCDAGPRAVDHAVLLSRCGDSTVDLTEDAGNCGACGHQCGETQRCVDGWCVCQGLDEAACGESCVPVTEERQCLEPSVAECGDLAVDADHCGACGNACQPGEVCEQGRCACTGTFCGETCVDLQTDAQNCGRCGRTCPFGCEEGACGARRVVVVNACEGLDEIRWSGWDTEIRDETLEAATDIEARFVFEVNYFSTRVQYAVISPNDVEYQSERDTRASGRLEVFVTIDRDEVDALGQWSLGVLSWTNGAGPQADICSVQLLFR